jgi:hypothetical protein
MIHFSKRKCYTVFGTELRAEISTQKLNWLLPTHYSRKSYSQFFCWISMPQWLHELLMLKAEITQNMERRELKHQDERWFQ